MSERDFSRLGFKIWKSEKFYFPFKVQRQTGVCQDVNPNDCIVLTLQHDHPQ